LDSPRSGRQTLAQRARSWAFVSRAEPGLDFDFASVKTDNVQVFICVSRAVYSTLNWRQSNGNRKDDTCAREGCRGPHD
jgi:hypothetical protein